MQQNVTYSASGCRVFGEQNHNLMKEQKPKSVLEEFKLPKNIRTEVRFNKPKPHHQSRITARILLSPSLLCPPSSVFLTFWVTYTAWCCLALAQEPGNKQEPPSKTGPLVPKGNHGLPAFPVVFFSSKLWLPNNIKFHLLRSWWLFIWWALTFLSPLSSPSPLIGDLCRLEESSISFFLGIKYLPRV